LVVVASSTAKYAKEVATTALESGIDYLDIQYSTQKVSQLKSMKEEIETARRCFITDGGFHPGSSRLVLCCRTLGYSEKVVVGRPSRRTGEASLADDTLVELLEEINDFVPLVYKDGRWKKSGMYGMLDTITVDFGENSGGNTVCRCSWKKCASCPN
jgi:saccharopine dehydrogenase (NAD+, L-lysine-forming)